MSNIKEKLKEAGLEAIGDRIEIIETAERACASSSRRARTVRSSSRSRRRSMTPTMKKTLEIIAQELVAAA